LFLLPLSSNIISFKERFSFVLKLHFFVLAAANVQPFYFLTSLFQKKITFLKKLQKLDVSSKKGTAKIQTF